MAYAHIRYDLAAGVATIALADPATLNALSLAMVEEIIAALTRASGEARAIILTGEGRGFCSGANLIGGAGFGAGDALKTHYNPMFNAIRDLPVPIVTAINGPAAGIGCTLALAGDLIVAAESAIFVQAFARIGLIPDGGSTFLLPRMIGKARAMEMMLLGEKISAAKAEQWGLINRVAPDGGLSALAQEMASKLAAGPASLALIRKAAWEGLDNEWAAQLDLEHQFQMRAGATRDFREGVAAFMEKRPPKFTGE
jgi:2-(1,2-epoxy-1,2-dihydrophenyl)acetyl-CoA isomerase